MSVAVFFMVFTYAILVGLFVWIIHSFNNLKSKISLSITVVMITGLLVFLRFIVASDFYITCFLAVVTAIILTKLLLLKVKTARPKGVIELIKTKSFWQFAKKKHYLIYGGLLYLFIFINRLVLWLHIPEFNTTIYPQNGRIDFAVLVFFLLVGIVEHARVSVQKFLNTDASKVKFLNSQSFNNQFVKMYWSHIKVLFLSSLLLSFLLYLIIAIPIENNLGIIQLIGLININVWVVSCIGYFLLAWGMLNSFYLFKLKQPWTPLKGMFLGCLVNFAVSSMFKAGMESELSGLGLLFGALIFMLLTLQETLHFYKTDAYYCLRS